ncbi:DUF748 domain-containing protein [Rudaea sp.]|uniref:DUF748 domain-containing protein n=1 Tax=Rudaea sp. TaxID=2136325 RepID=UPI00321F85BC
MPASTASLKARALDARDRTLALRHSRRARKLALIAAIVLVVYALLGFLLVPALLQRWVDANAGKLLGRPVSIAALQFNPFTLKLGADRVHVADVDGKAPFVDIDRLVLNGAWSSLLRRAPVLDEVEIEHPRIALARTADGRFNFSDLIDRFAAKPATDAKAPPPEPARFSLSNISVHRGEIRFDDKPRNASHRVEDIEIGIPFLANLPRDVDVFVQPLLAARIDGRPLRIEGQTKPFKDSLESTIDLTLDRLDLPQYLPYVPTDLPVAIPRGLVSGSVRAHFVQDKAAQQLRLDGVIVLDDFAMTDKAKTPILDATRVIASFADVEPLISRYRFGNVNLDHVKLRYVARPGGRSNFDALYAKPRPPNDKTPASEFAIANLGFVAGRFDYVDTTLGNRCTSVASEDSSRVAGAQEPEHTGESVGIPSTAGVRNVERSSLCSDSPATATISDLTGSVSGLDTVRGASTTVEVSAKHNGGDVATSGKLDLAASRYTGTLSAKSVGLAPLQPFLLPAGSQATIQRGRLDTEGSFVADWKGLFNLHVEPAKSTLHEVAIGLKDAKEPALAWKAVDIALTRFDLAAGEARQGDVVVHGLRVNARREHDGRFDLASLVGNGPAAKPAAAAKSTKPMQPWKWSIARLAFDDAGATIEDRATAKPSRIAVESIKGDITGLSENLKQPLKLALSGAIDHGGFEVDGSVRPVPLDADLKLKTRELDLAGLTAYADVPLNVRVASALLTSDGTLRYVEAQPAKTAYRGRVTLARARVLDKLSGDDFASFRTLNIGAVDYLQNGAAPMQLKLGDIALADFYARIIMNASGRLNLADISGSNTAAPVSLTRAQGPENPAPAPRTAKPAAKPEPAKSAAPAASIQVGQITLSRGHLNYTDNFIKPNYNANITQLSGKIGAFGTTGGEPAVVTLRGLLDDNAQVDIDGKINPLAPVAYAEIKGKADGVELTHMSAYSAKYTGYPIIKGRLNADVSYLLDQGRLKANNHLYIDQLTFGDENKDPGVSHLPVKLAVALLKDSDGVIDVNVPVSGSLDDPQFSLGGVVWRAFAGMIARAVTAPFRLLASAFKGGGGGGEELGYVEFAPGADGLDDAAKAKLAQIAKMVNARPAIHLGIVGRTDPKFDEEGLRRVTVDGLIRQEYAHDHGDADEAAAAPLSPADTDKYLEAAYKHGKFPKEKTLGFLTKSQPPEEMRRLLEANVTIDDASMLHLAERRAGHIVGFLHGKVEDRRLWTLAPKLDAKGIDDQGKTTRVDFTLQ